MLHDIRRVSSAKGSMLLLRRSDFNEPQAFFDHFFRRCLETVAIISVKLFSRQNGFYRVLNLFCASICLLLPHSASSSGRAFFANASKSTESGA